MASRCPEIPRARFRILFFAILAIACAVAGWWPAAAVACLGLAAALVSLPVAHGHGRRLALSFVTLDWLCLGLVWVVTGGLASPLIYTLPLLLAAHLLPTPRHDWMYVTGPMLAGVAVLLIGTGGGAGGRVLLFTQLAGLTAVGLLPPYLLRRRRSGRLTRRQEPRERRAARTGPRLSTTRPDVDPTTGLPGLPRVIDSLTAVVREAAATHQAVGVVCVRLERWTQLRDSRGELAAEAAAAAAARHVRRHLRPRDEAFRVRGDTFLLVLRDKTTSQSERVAAELGAALAAHRLERGRETLQAACGVSSYPATRSIADLLRESATAAETPAEMVSAGSR